MMAGFSRCNAMEVRGAGLQVQPVFCPGNRVFPAENPVSRAETGLKRLLNNRLSVRHFDVILLEQLPDVIAPLFGNLFEHVLAFRWFGITEAFEGLLLHRFPLLFRELRRAALASSARRATTGSALAGTAGGLARTSTGAASPSSRPCAWTTRATWASRAFARTTGPALGPAALALVVLAGAWGLRLVRLGLVVAEERFGVENDLVALFETFRHFDHFVVARPDGDHFPLGT